MRTALIGALLALAACRPPHGPANVTADAGSLVILDIDAAGATGGPCAAACIVLSIMGCKAGLQPDCVQVLAHIDGAWEIRTPSGHPLTCEAIAEAHDSSEVNALGVKCP